MAMQRPQHMVSEEVFILVDQHRQDKQRFGGTLCLDVESNDQSNSTNYA